MILDKIILHAPMSFEFILVCYILNLYMVYVDLGNKDGKHWYFTDILTLNLKALYSLIFQTYSIKSKIYFSIMNTKSVDQQSDVLNIMHYAKINRF